MGLLVDYLLARLNVIVGKLETNFNTSNFIINSIITALCGYNKLGVGNIYVHSYRMPTNWRRGGDVLRFTCMSRLGRLLKHTCTSGHAALAHFQKRFAYTHARNLGTHYTRVRRCFLVKMAVLRTVPRHLSMEHQYYSWI